MNHAPTASSNTKAAAPIPIPAAAPVEIPVLETEPDVPVELAEVMVADEDDTVVEDATDDCSHESGQ